MKSLIIFVSALILQQNAFAKTGEIPTEADYVVPTSADLVDHSRFIIKIEQPYTGATTDTISYVFPAELTGVENQVVTLTRIGKTNNWDSPEMTAACTESDELFSCNIYLKKVLEPVVQKQSVFGLLDLAPVVKNNFIAGKAHKCGAVMAMSFIDPTNVESFLSGLPKDLFDKKMAVANSFACSEPAGILSYEFK